MEGATRAFWHWGKQMFLFLFFLLHSRNSLNIRSEFTLKIIPLQLILFFFSFFLFFFINKLTESILCFYFLQREKRHAILIELLLIEIKWHKVHSKCTQGRNNIITHSFFFNYLLMMKRCIWFRQNKCGAMSPIATCNRNFCMNSM